MNRRARRSARRAGVPADVLAAADHLGRCPDCLSQAQLGEDAPGVWALVVAHDPTCPVLRRTVAGRGRP